LAISCTLFFAPLAISFTFPTPLDNKTFPLSKSPGALGPASFTGAAYPGPRLNKVFPAALSNPQVAFNLFSSNTSCS
jgi:hypothetical protein